MSAPKHKTEAAPALLPVSADSLDYRAHDLDLYIRHNGQSPPVLYRGRGIDFTEADGRRLVEQGIRFLYIPAAQHGLYRKALAQRLDRLFAAPGRAPAARAGRARSLRAACTKVIDDVLSLAARPEPIAAVRLVADRFAAWASSDREGFSYLLDMSAHDFHTATHLLNVGVGCGLLAHELRLDPAGVAAMHQGGMLHDIGKRAVPAHILAKEGRLDDEDWPLVRRHPTQGFEELSRIPWIAPAALEMARDHHERPDGQGYPRGLRAGEIGLPARVCAVVDAFDTITATRPDRGPTPPLDALAMMAAGAGNRFDAEVLAAWDRVVRRLIKADPSRAVAPTGGAAGVSLDDLLPSGRLAAPDAPRAAADARPAPLPHDNRRHLQRFGCELAASAVFVRQLKPCPVKPGEAFAVHTVNLSQSGIQVRTPWPLSMNDILELRMPTKGGLVSRRIRVVRVRQNMKREWVAGACFVGRHEGSEAA